MPVQMPAPHNDGQAISGPGADPVVRGLVGVFDAAFPGRVRGCYLLGSYAEGTTVGLSDVDLVVLFKGGFAAGEEERANRLVSACGLLSAVRLDVVLRCEASLPAEDVRLKLGSVLVGGEDVRAGLPLPTPEAHARYMTGWAEHFIRLLHDGAGPGQPLRYPDAADAFYGYARVRIPEWYPPGATAGTKELVAGVCWTATALLSLLHGAAGYAGTKGEAVSRYRDAGDGEWGGYVAAVYGRCKGAWRYGVPEGAAERDELRALCQRALPFFAHYQAVYREYLGRQREAGEADGENAGM